MKRLKIEFWHKVFYFGTFLEHIGDKLACVGMDKTDDLSRDDPEIVQYQKKRGMIL